MNLDDLNIYKQLDPSNLYKNISELPSQFENAWIEINKLVLPSYYLKANKVLILGMGGSGIGGEFARSLTLNTSEIPIYTHHNYSIPEFVDDRTLIIAVSYSGNTEEVTDGFVEAYKKNAKLVAITSGGELEKLALKYRAPYYRFAYKSPPRAALGYLLISVIGILKKLNIIDIAEQDLKTTVSALKSQFEKLNRDIPTAKNPAKKLAEKLHSKIPIIYGADQLESVAIRWKTQINENAKTAAYAEAIPESNHNSLVGLDFPLELKEKLTFIILQSKNNHAKSLLRQGFFSKTLKNKHISVELISSEYASNSPLVEISTLIYFGDLVSYYLAILNATDPFPVDIISKLKNAIKEKKSE
ncbi:bifunctional phosphoglucose/phosphomannose isomerase [Patescibacteria group bacterium]